MHVFVAGATGAIGRPLLAQLAAAGHRVTGMTRSPQRAEQLREQGFEAVVADALDRGGVIEAVVQARPDAVIHELTDLPAELDPRRYAKLLAGTNRLRREGTANLLAAAREAGVRRVVAQSIAFAYAPTGDWVKDEAAPLAHELGPPMNEAIGAVAELERQVLELGGIVLRYGFFYGPGTSFARDGYYATLMRKRQLPILGRGEGRWSFIQIDDAAAATVAALERGSPGIYNIVDEDPARASEWIPVFAEAIGAPRPWRLPLWLGRLAAGPVVVLGMSTQRAASGAKARRELGWTPSHPSWRTGFKDQP